MSEYIVCVDDLEEPYYRYTDIKPETVFGHRLREEIVRCRDCKFYEPSRWYESAIFPPLGTDIEHVCTFFADCVKVEPDGFCAWGERREP